MCMGCGSTFLQSSSDQAPDTIDTTLWLIALGIWIMWLHHMKGRLTTKVQHIKKQIDRPICFFMINETF